MDFKDVTKMSVKELKAELALYGVDPAAAGCVEKKDLKNLLAKTRKEQGWPPKQSAKKATSGDGDDGSATTSSGATSAGARSGGGAARVDPSRAALPRSLRVAVLFDPDNDDVRDCSTFIQPFFMHTPECTSGSADIKVSWIMPVGLRDDLIRFQLPAQLANFDWFQALFVDQHGNVTDFDDAPVAALADAGDDKQRDGPRAAINQYARVAERWNADWLVVRRAGGTLGHRWLSTTAGAFGANHRAAYVPGVLLLDRKWHASNVMSVVKSGGAAGHSVVVPETLDPLGAWYYWLLSVYPEKLVYALDKADEPDDDADKVMLACEDDQWQAAHDALDNAATA